MPSCWGYTLETLPLSHPFYTLLSLVLGWNVENFKVWLPITVTQTAPDTESLHGDQAQPCRIDPGVCRYEVSRSRQLHFAFLLYYRSPITKCPFIIRTFRNPCSQPPDNIVSNIVYVEYRDPFGTLIIGTCPQFLYLCCNANFLSQLYIPLLFFLCPFFSFLFICFVTGTRSYFRARLSKRKFILLFRVVSFISFESCKDFFD